MNMGKGVIYFKNVPSHFAESNFNNLAIMI